MASPVQEGDILAEKYRVERVLGIGGMGVVVAATHLELDQRVALKFLLPEALAHPEIVERFAREARAAAKIRSQHVARVIDTGKLPNGTPFMVMEYLEGKDLSELLEQGGRLPIETAVDYVLQASEAIAEAHHAGIVHRDLKPANLFLAAQPDRRSIIKLLDFGISKVADPKSAQLTHTATMMGSPHYMSPEQLTSSRDVDAGTDIWALGVILYELVSGVRPFDADTLPEIVAKILQNEPPPLVSVRPDVPFGMVSIVAKCLRTSRSQRFASVAELATALAPFSTDAQSAAASVARITRVLGGASVPPQALSARMDVDATVKPAGSVVVIPVSEAAPSTRVSSNTGESKSPMSAEAALVKTQMAGSLATKDEEPPPRKQSALMFVGAGALLLGAALVFVVTRSGPTDKGGIGPIVSATSPVITATEIPTVATAPSAMPSAMAAVSALPSTTASAVVPAIAMATATTKSTGKHFVPIAPIAPPTASAKVVVAPAASTGEPKSTLQMGIK